MENKQNKNQDNENLENVEQAKGFPGWVEVAQASVRCMFIFLCFWAGCDNTINVSESAPLFLY